MIFVSTGGFRGKTGAAATRELASEGIGCVELSGGTYSGSLLAELLALVPTTRFQLHNYFPPPATPFVLNLASLDQEIGQRSTAHVEQALEWCSALGASCYSVHAGFLLDPKVDELGERIGGRRLFNRQDCTEAFVDRVSHAAEQAEKLGMTLMVENNVLSGANASIFDANPFLMCDPEECRDIMERTPDNVRLLIDVGHLRVSARSLDFDPVSMFKTCHDWIAGYHLSDNNGLEDSNEMVSTDSWFWPHLRTDVDYYAVEVYGAHSAQLRRQVDLVQSALVINQ